MIKIFIQHKYWCLLVNSEKLEQWGTDITHMKSTNDIVQVYYCSVNLHLTLPFKCGFKLL